MAKIDDYTQHYQMGEQAAWRGDSVDAMPKFRRASRVAAWLKGHSDGTQEKQRRDDARQADKGGINKLKAIIAAAGG